MKADIEYSLDGQTWTKLNTTSDLSRDTSPVQSEYNVTISVAAGSTLKLRVYPWMNNADNGGRYLAIYGVKIAGKVE
ncbi:MAG: hypothetical protein CGU28_14100 [Candidatus Dactylopiibacterium carminicum]|uniref:F5/8 type C domain-containing protein n=1 Tax=Candidatus Dactylopiibacterium carminicum TaxID=857335 RepID=A0A272ET84_9RHOO|nr:hypothetical protein [Candidatus Dactylopiibacterium carminicum]KAF7599333.1 hypothetical protein BGI27_08645 [Candidatus Dactylopiibacterium carminicum]PAS93323.1 MAG: hypothetical protein CGU29_08295 [Candidatus Dactylopiibacterium carminicum]PAS94346.1 MAG: hypothetical protein CGU28_14100 [Candidatus Dactylopiibacterium carminicum]PAS99336.1 MAG: hypothetical protein BSR46_08680 [Candidatus Dactylopiibacterium carminicum]